jgi:DnaJ-class molecular chaperone
MEQTYYSTLGVPPDASTADIKRAWRAIAFEFHPDRNGNKESAAFTRASAAWNVLSDPAKKQSYDRQLLSHDTMFRDSVDAAGVHPFQGEVFNVLFEEMARMRNYFGGAGGGEANRSSSSYVKPHPIMKSVKIPLQDAFRRPDIDITVRRWALVDGVRTDEDAIIAVQVPVLDNEGCGVVTVANEGHSLGRHARGDIKVAFQTTLDSRAALRGGGNVECVWDITLKEALCGFSITFDHPNGKQYAVSSKGAVVPSGHKHVLPGLGLELANGTRGDFVLVFSVEFPTTIADEVRATVQQHM